MELSKALLGAILVGVTIGNASCSKSNATTVNPKQVTDVMQPTPGENVENPAPHNCEACGMG